MKIVYIKLVNFADVYAAMGKHEVEFHFDGIDKPIIQIYGRNRCGKTVLLQKLHPFSSVNLNGDERNDMPQILKGEIGIKNIVYEVNGEVYNITHTYNPNKNGHTVVSSIMKDGVELNANGGVNTFNAVVEKVFGLNRYVFQFIINGTQLTSFANMNATQRKTLMNKAMGIDIYDKIHKLATEDYRYTSKLITSLTRTKEFLLQSYGSYETLRTTLEQTRVQHVSLTESMQQMKTRLDQLTGMITSLRQLNLGNELMELQNKLVTYKNVVAELGQYDMNLYESLMEEQLRLTDEMGKVSSQRMLLMKDLDAVYEKKNHLQTNMMSRQRIIGDYQNMVQMKERLEHEIAQLQIGDLDVQASSAVFSSMLSIAKSVNDTCKEITLCLSKEHLELFCDMLLKGIDVNAFLMQESSVLLDSEKEKSAISRLRHMLSSVGGDLVSEQDCRYPNCLYRNTFERLHQYFDSYESVSRGKFTMYDLENIEHAWKNYQTICRLLRIEIPVELQNDMCEKSVLIRLKNGHSGIDEDFIKKWMEIAVNKEHYNQLIKQLSDVEARIKDIEYLMQNDTTNGDVPIEVLEKQIAELQQQISDCERLVNEYKQALSEIDRKKVLLSSIKNIDIGDVQVRYDKLNRQQTQLSNAELEYGQLHEQYVQIQSHVQIVAKQLETLENADKQYVRTVDEIEKHLTMDERYKIISEATSSTKGKPVIAIRDKISEALSMANRLLDVMYDGEIELLKPTIDETTFTLPFRCGTNKSEDIRTGSQSESTLLSLALSLSLASSLTHYNVFLVDECDGYLDMEQSNLYVMMLQNVMNTMKIEQCFVVSHHIEGDQYDNCVYQLKIES